MRRSKLGGYDLESFQHGNVSSFEQSKGMMGHSISFLASGNKVTLKWISDAAAMQQFVAAVKQGMSPVVSPAPVKMPGRNVAQQPRRRAQLPLRMTTLRSSTQSSSWAISIMLEYSARRSSPPRRRSCWPVSSGRMLRTRKSRPVPDVRPGAGPGYWRRGHGRWFTAACRGPRPPIGESMRCSRGPHWTINIESQL